MKQTISRLSSPGRRWLVLASAATAAVALASAIGILPTLRLAGQPGVEAMTAAAIAVWLASAVGAVPAAMASASQPQGILTAVQTGTLLRFILTLAAAAALVFGTSLPRTTLVLWMALDYLAALATTTSMELWLLRKKRTEASA